MGSSKDMQNKKQLPRIYTWKLLFCFFTMRRQNSPKNYCFLRYYKSKYLKRGIIMENLSKEYILLFNAILDAENTLESLKERLIKAQIDAEEIYISKDD